VIRPRAVQRALFRMQHDPGFAARLRDREHEAVSSADLSEDELSLLLEASAAAIGADAGGRRLAQFLRNVSSEHALTLARAASVAPEMLASFPASESFHRAIHEDLRLPIAFAEHAAAVAAASGDALLVALASIERAMARARRDGFAHGRGSGRFALSPRATILAVPAGSLQAAATLREALDASGDVPVDLRVEPSTTEHVLVLGAPRESAHRLAEATLELLSPLAGALLMLVRDGGDDDALAAFRARHAASEDEVEGFLTSLVADGVVIPAG
jgi:hypothetical protein